MNSEQLSPVQGTNSMRSALKSLRDTNANHKAIKVLEDRGILNLGADPLGWNIMVAHLYAYFANSDAIFAAVNELQQSNQNNDETLAKYFRRCLTLGEACRRKMDLASIGAKIVGRHDSEPSKKLKRSF